MTNDEESTSTSDAVEPDNMNRAVIGYAIAIRCPYALSKTPSNTLPTAVRIGA